MNGDQVVRLALPVHTRHEDQFAVGVAVDLGLVRGVRRQGLSAAAIEGPDRDRPVGELGHRGQIAAQPAEATGRQGVGRPGDVREGAPPDGRAVGREQLKEEGPRVILA